jgi:[ribosomal protein S18]-alanine N-acetyltransferase
VNLLKIAPLTIDRLNSILELDRLCFGELWTLDAYQREIASPNSYLAVLSVRENDRGSIEPEALKPNFLEKTIGLGCFWTILEEAHITILAIHPNYQNCGLGQLMLCHILQVACDRGLERATLEVRDSNQAALHLYQKFGFQIAGRRKKYYQKTGEDALVLWCKDFNKPEFKEKLALWQRDNQQRLDRNNYRM